MGSAAAPNHARQFCHRFEFEPATKALSRRGPKSLRSSCGGRAICAKAINRVIEVKYLDMRHESIKKRRIYTTKPGNGQYEGNARVTLILRKPIMLG
ncbi:hypothetical protein PoB_003479300 [Plakobranchus ocellatus]|uniref:Uncharacterized protein n=1 Tax=Plakobranchus ocellatus TaxID=259542 RepID=A0AAV4ALV1_9GAST|nr:hypothetical protein PoB_003479300 [Plakobranchus ocellatus]